MCGRELWTNTQCLDLIFYSFPAVLPMNFTPHHHQHWHGYPLPFLMIICEKKHANENGIYEKYEKSLRTRGVRTEGQQNFDIINPICIPFTGPWIVIDLYAYTITIKLHWKGSFFFKLLFDTVRIARAGVRKRGLSLFLMYFQSTALIAPKGNKKWRTN